MGEEPQLDVSFEEYDAETKRIKAKSPPKRWSDEEERYVLLHHEDGDHDVASALGRTSMSIYMHKSGLLSDFDGWLRNEGLQYKNSTREEQVDAFLNFDLEEE